MRPLRFYVNVDHVATVREARKTDEPDPLLAALEAEAHGADGITIHLREDRRHINDRDAVAVAHGVRTICNLELGISDEIVAIACQLHPYQVTLVPERREEVTTEGGLDLTRDTPRLRRAIERLAAAGCHVSLFIDPDQAAIRAAADLGVPAVELHTGRYSHAWQDGPAALDQLRDAAALGTRLGLAVHAGHGLTYRNVQPVASIPDIEELNIGHSIISRAMFTGIGPAVREMKRLLTEARA
jgi:pyridoxine 5-phosphate synthase